MVNGSRSQMVTTDIFSSVWLIDTGMGKLNFMLLCDLSDETATGDCSVRFDRFDIFDVVREMHAELFHRVE